MNKATIEYERDGQPYTVNINFESCDLYTDYDTVEVMGGKDNAKLMSFSTNKHLKIDLINPNNIFVIPTPNEEEEIKIDYVVIPEKPKKKRKRKKKKKRKFDNGRKTN